MAEPILRIRHLTIRATSRKGSTDLLRNISLDLCPGEVLGLIGESGAGKSTLGLAAMGHMRGGCHAAEGQVVFDGQDLLHAAPRVLRQVRGGGVAYVAQSAAAAFNPSFTLGAQIDEVLRRFDASPAAERRQRIIDLMARLGLPDPIGFYGRYPHQVSGGQLQRAMTVMALAPRPKIIVFDEPTTALDVTTQLGVLAAIRKAIREEGTAALYISHDLAIVSQIADRIMVLRHGALVEEGAARDVVERPTSSYTRSLLQVGTQPASPRDPTPAPPILTVRNLQASYGPLRVLSDINLTVRKGRTLAVVGESGSGKSTLARVIAGLHAADTGSITFAGENLPPALRQRGRDVLRRVQMVFQSADTALNPAQTVGDIIGRPIAFYFNPGRAEVRRRVAALLEAVELAPELAERRPTALSGGQKQRVAIARALAAEPDLILCDEVTSALDPLVGEGVLNLLDKLRRERGVSYLFITHDLGVVRSIADDIVVMERGRIIEFGSRDDVLAPPWHPTTELLLASQPSTEAGWLDRALERRSRLVGEAEPLAAEMAPGGAAPIRAPTLATP
jgi:peptide/nickel transport system ATP-binding protein